MLTLRPYLGRLGLMEREDHLPARDLGFRALADRVRDAVIVADSDSGAILLWNAAAAETFGYTADEACDRDVGTLIPESAMRAALAGDLERVEEGTAPGARHEVPAIHKHGVPLWIDLTVSPLFAPAIEREVLLVIARGVTARVLAETERDRLLAALRESEARFHGAFEHAAIGMALVSPDGRWLQVNRALCALVGYRPDSLQALSFQELTHPDDRATSQAQARRLLAGEIGPYQLEQRYLHRDGHVVWVLLAVSLVRDDLGRPRYFVMQVKDVTARKQAGEELARRAEALAEANRALEAKTREQERFIYTVAHDLRAPLVALRGMADLLVEQHGARLDADVQRYLQRIQGNAGRLQALLNDLLELSRIGRVDAETGPVDLAEVVLDVVEQLRHTLAARQVTVRVTGTLPVVSGSRSRLTQLMTNLIDNAVTYTPADRVPEVEIGALERDDTWEILVRDRGIGIAPGFQERVFGIFQRAPSGRAINPEGSGVGLAIVARIAETHGGRCWLESREGTGTTVHVALPRAASAVDAGRQEGGE